MSAEIGRNGHETDKALLAAVVRRDVAGFERLHRRFHKRVFGFAMRLVDRADLAEEVVSDTMLAVWQKAPSFEGRSSVSTWVFAIAYRAALKARGRHRHDHLHDEIDEGMQADRTGTDEVEALFTAKTVAAALEQLPLAQRATVELTYFYGYQLAEIAEITNCPVGTVKTRMFHARIKLKHLLTGHASSLGDVA